MPTPQNVFAIDDDPAVLASLRAILKASGYDPICCLSASEILQWLKPDLTGCVITDLQMPGMSGRDLIFLLRDMAPNLSVIIVTGYADVSLAVRLMEEGALTLLEKPYNSVNLLAAVERGLRQSLARKRAADYLVQTNEKIQSLDAQELEVLECVLSGLADTQIFAKLGLTETEVAERKSSILSKMGTTSMIELNALFALTGQLFVGGNRSNHSLD